MTENRPYINNLGQKRYEYKRVCPCGDVAWVRYIPEPGMLCKTCARSKSGKAMSQRNIKKEEDKIRYYYFCPYCPAVTIKDAKKKTSLCGDCNRKYSKRLAKGETISVTKYEEEKMRAQVRHFRICPHCPEDNNTKRVMKKELAGIKPCPKHEKKLNAKTKETEHIADRKEKKLPARKLYRKPRDASPEAIAKVRELNRIYKAELAREAEEANRNTVPPVQRKTDEEMLAEFLANNEPSVKIADEGPMKHYYSGKGLGSRSSVLSPE